MARTRILTEDLAGTTLAVLAHAGLLAWLVWAPRPAPLPAPQRVTVTLSGEVGEQSTSPSREAAAPAAAPVLSPDPVPAPAPSPLPQPLAKMAPQPLARPAPVPARTSPPPPSRLGRDFLKGLTAPQGASAPSGGASRLGTDFLKGVTGGDARGKSQVAPGDALSSQVRSSLVSEVSRQLKPHWQQPDGIDVDKLATTVEWDLNPDGTLAGSPRVIAQSGVNSANRAQSDRHKELAVRAVRRAAPFTLPPRFYAGWQHLRFTFDWKLN